MLEKMYADFVANVLPKVQEGLVITKDYFFDLFGRYVKYLIVIDSLLVGFSIVLAVFGGCVTYRVHKAVKDTKDDGVQWFVAFFVTFICFGIFFSNVDDLIKDIYIPEVRVYEELQHFKK